MFRRTIYRATFLIMLLVMVSSGFVLWKYRTTIIGDARSRASTMAYLLAEQTTRTFQAVDLTLVGLDAVFEAAPLPAHAPAFERLLAQRVADLDFIRALYVVDPSGLVIQSSGMLKDGESAAADRDYLDAFARNAKLDFMIGQPVFNHPRMLTAIPVMRRLNAVDGHFAGLIVAHLDPKYFRDFYRGVDLGRGGSINLYQDNGSILLASSGTVASTIMPSMIVPAPIFDNESRLGLLRSPSATNAEQLLAYHRAQGYPLVVAVGMDVKAIRSRWWHIAAPALGALGVTTLMGIALAVLIARRMEERRHAQSRAIMVQKLEALGQMTASVSHDFRNLLTVMRSTLQLVRKHGPAENILSAAEAAVERGSGLVTQLLAFSRRHALELQAANINALLAGLTQVLAHAAGHDVTLDIDAAGDLPPCKADQTQFDAAMMNLVINARQAMPQGGKVSISTRLCTAPSAKAGRFVELRVSDTGIGIAPGDLRRIFEPFFTTKTDTGTGLGLSQVYGFMRQIGGEVAVSSVVGAGTTFTLLFPVVDAVLGGPPGEAVQEDPPSPGTRARREETFAQP